MECNRDEALRAKEIAEKKLATQDYHGAQKFLQKALQLFPGLENMAQMSAVLDVHIAAQAKVNGTETDWYGILQVDPVAEDVIIKKQYKKLALLLHPDKNKFAGAEAAFKLIGEALQILSDKQQRSVYDSRRKTGGKGGSTTQRSRQTSSHAYASRQTTASNTFITVCPSCHTRYQYYRVYENQNLLCHQCRIPFLARECYASSSNGGYGTYGWQHFNQMPQGYNPSSFQPFASATNFASGVGAHAGNQMQGGARNTGVPSGVPTAEYVNQMFKERAQAEDAAQGLKRKRKDEKDAEKEMRRLEKEQQKKMKADLRAQEAQEKEMLRRKKQADKAAEKDKRRRSKRHLSDSSEDDEDESESMDDFSDDQIINNVVDSKAAPRRSSRPRRNVTYKVDVSDDEEDTQTQVTKEEHKSSKEDADGKDKDVQNGDAAEKQQLADFFKIRIRLNLAKSSASVKEENGDSMKTKSRKLEEGYEVGETPAEDPSLLNEEASGGVKGVTTDSEGDKSLKKEEGKGLKQEQDIDETDGYVDEETKDDSSPDSEAEHETDGEAEEEPEKFSVPDPDFHDFDEDRKEKDVKAGQLWASYDDVDGLPRFYFKVKEVQSQNPFKVSICWLELQNLTTEQQALKRLGFSPTCGNSFKFTTTQTLNSMNMFSHQLKWEKGSKGTVMIYPCKGDVWALYRNWKPGLRYKKKSSLQDYDMVEVLTDFNKQTGVSVASLEKLPDYKTLFKSSEAHQKIPAGELCRFSYQVPAYKLQGDEAPDNQKGCWELDPASIPTNLIFSGSSKTNSL